jgi:hypothetical protein
MQRCARNFALVGAPLVAYPHTAPAEPAPFSSPKVSWPPIDEGRVKNRAISAESGQQKPATEKSGVVLDGREQFARTEVDLSSMVFHDLPTGEEGVREGVRRLVSKDPKIAASLLRLAFHDAIARDTELRSGGANGSIRFELDRRANYGLSRPIEALAKIQTASGLSWADTIVLGGAEAVAGL